MSTLSFSDFILQNEIIGFFEKPLTLKSGRLSHFYVNWRKSTNDAYLLDQLTDYLVAFLKEHNLSFDTLYGVPEGATKTAVLAAMKWAKQSPHFAPESHIIAMGRAKPKPHGDPADRFFIGQPRGTTFVLEDTVTTGLSLFQCLDQLLEAGVDVRGVICLTDRCEQRDDGLSVADYLQKTYGGKISYYPMSRAPELLRLAVKRRQPAKALVEALASELNLPLQDLLA
jgi:orotate phosphoribosyltransferase